MMNELSFKPLAITALTVFSLNAATAFAADPPTGVQDAIPVAKALSGTKKDDGWYNLSSSSKTKIVDGASITISGNTGYPSGFGFPPSTSAWTNPIASQVNSGGVKANFNKVGNNAENTFGPYPATDGLYALSFTNVANAKGGTLGVFEANPVADLANVVFQVEIGGANGYDFYRPGTPAGTVASGTPQIGALTNIDYSPKLNLTFAGGATTTLTAGWAELSAQGENGTTTIPGGGTEAIYVNLYAFQWDLSSYNNISSFNITFDVVEHSQTYAARLTQSDVFNQVVAVPEPESYAMLLAGLGLIGFAARRRQA